MVYLLKMVDLSMAMLNNQRVQTTNLSTPFLFQQPAKIAPLDLDETPGFWIFSQAMKTSSFLYMSISVNMSQSYSVCLGTPVFFQNSPIWSPSGWSKPCMPANGGGRVAREMPTCEDHSGQEPCFWVAHEGEGQNLGLNINAIKTGRLISVPSDNLKI